MSIYTILSSKPHNQHYLKRYIKFIEQCLIKNTGALPEYTERHHICPKSKDLFPEYGIFKDNSWNMARLSGRQHYIAHRILNLVYPWSNVVFGYKRMQTQTSKRDKTIKINSRDYEKIKLECAKKMSRSMKEYMIKHGHPKGMLGKTHSPELCTKLSLTNTGTGNPMHGSVRKDLSLINKDPIIAMKKGKSGSLTKQKWKLELFNCDSELELYFLLTNVIHKYDCFKVHKHNKNKIIDFKKLQTVLNKDITIRQLECFYFNKRIQSLVSSSSTLE